MFAQPFVQVQIKENIKPPRHWPFWGTSNAENVSFVGITKSAGLQWMTTSTILSYRIWKYEITHGWSWHCQISWQKWFNVGIFVHDLMSCDILNGSQDEDEVSWQKWKLAYKGICTCNKLTPMKSLRLKKRSGSRLNIKMPSYQYRDSHFKDKTVSPTVLSLTWESPYLGKMVFILRQGPNPRITRAVIKLMHQCDDVHTQATQKEWFHIMTELRGPEKLEK